jgi:hypothetical protein
VSWAEALVAAGCIGGALLWSPPVSGDTDDCGDSSRPWILVEFGVEPMPMTNLPEGEVTRQLRAGLSKRGIDVCTKTPTSSPGDGSEVPIPLSGRAPPMATIVFSSVDKDGVALTLEVRDALTAKRVGRQVDLHTTPADGRALVLAVEADELLRATWAELAMKDAPSTPARVPVQVRRAVASSIAPPASRGAIGARAALERFTGGLTFFGGDVRSEYWFGSRWGAAVSIGYRQTLTTAHSALGELSTNALHAGLGGLFAIVPRDRVFGLDATVAIDSFAVYFDPRAGPDALATPSSDWAMMATVALIGWVVLSHPLRVGWEAGASLPLRAVAATSGGETLQSTRGVGLLGSVDVAFSF